MAGRLPDGRRPAGVRVETVDGSWSSPPVFPARGIRERVIGLRPWPLGHGLLLTGAAVHGHGMVEPLVAVGLDSRGCVVDVRRLFPGSALRLRGAAMVLELPAVHPVPGVGTRLVARPMLAGCRDD